jgi:hypothetical protein
LRKVGTTNQWLNLEHQKKIRTEDVQIFIYDHNKDQVANYALDVLANSDAWTTPGMSGLPGI